jgi:hypothetical protein
MRILTAKLTGPIITQGIDLDNLPNELVKASAITASRRQMVVAMRKALIEKAAILDESDIRFEIEERTL